MTFDHTIPTAGNCRCPTFTSNATNAARRPGGAVACGAAQSVAAAVRGKRMKTIIHVNQHKIRKREDKPLTVKTYKDNREAAEALILRDGEVVAKVVYRPDKPLSCGARVWIETDLEVEVQ